MILLVLLGIVGGVATLAFLWPYGALTACLGAPFGASFLVLAASFVIALRKPAQDIQPEERQEQINPVRYKADLIR